MEIQGMEELKKNIELEKKYWFGKIKRNLDRRRYGDNDSRDFVLLEVLELDKCCLIDDYYVDNHLINYYKQNNSIIDKLKLNREDFERNGLSLYSSEGGINPFMINQWFKECKNEILKRI
tara:strand:- start:6966 stop:7325 length:360 start_codon:yes stop_codon:yes gene_type:complete